MARADTKTTSRWPLQWIVKDGSRNERLCVFIKNDIEVELHHIVEDQFGRPRLG